MVLKRNFSRFKISIDEKRKNGIVLICRIKVDCIGKTEKKKLIY